MPKDVRLHKVHLELKDMLSLKPLATPFKNFKSLNQNLRTGQGRSRFRGRGMEFEEARHYVYGDEIRHIDWRVTARTGKPHTKVFQQERQQSVFFFIDLSESLYFGTQVTFKSALAIQTAAFLAWKHLASGHEVGGFYCKDTRWQGFSASRQEGILILLLKEWIAAHNARKITNAHFNTLPPYIKKMSSTGSILYILGDFYNTEVIELIQKQLTGHVQIRWIYLQDPLEEKLPQKGLFGFKNSHEHLSLCTDNFSTRAAYQNAALNRLQQIKRLCRGKNTRFLQLKTTDNIIECLTELS